MPEECVIPQRLDIIAHFLPLDSSEKQINIHVFVNHFDAGYKCLSYQHKFLHTLILLFICLKNFR